MTRRDEPPEFRTGAEWKATADPDAARVRVVGRAHDGFLMVERISGAPPEYLGRPFPIEDRNLREVYEPVNPPARADVPRLAVLWQDTKRGTWSLAWLGNDPAAARENAGLERPAMEPGEAVVVKLEPVTS